MHILLTLQPFLFKVSPILNTLILSSTSWHLCVHLGAYAQSMETGLNALLRGVGSAVVKGSKDKVVEDHALPEVVNAAVSVCTVYVKGTALIQQVLVTHRFPTPKQRLNTQTV